LKFICYFINLFLKAFQYLFKKIINNIADKNIRLLPQFREKYPEYINSSSKISDKYDKMVIEVMSTEGDKKDKIIRNISKVTTINDKYTEA
jgi:hypothetical protein